MLPDIPIRKSAAGDAEKGQSHEDNLDRHVEDVLSKRDQYRRILKGVWAFMKTRESLFCEMFVDRDLTHVEHSNGRKSRRYAIPEDVLSRLAPSGYCVNIRFLHRYVHQTRYNGL